MFERFRRPPETREQSSYSDVLVDLIVERAKGATAKATATAAVETAAGMIAREFASAEVNAPPAVMAALDPKCLHLIGRSLIRRGEFVARIELDGTDRLRLAPAADWDVRGGPDPMSWRYRLNLPGPSRWNETVVTPADRVLHVMFAVDASRPWRGVGPIQSASLAGTLSAETAALLGDEASGPRGHYVPQPKPGDDPGLARIAADTSGAKGAVLFVETTQKDFGQGGRVSVGNDWQAQRFGMNTPAAVLEAARHATEEILNACGIPSALARTNADGTSQREALRRLQLTTVEPLAKILAAECSAKFGSPVAFDFDSYGRDLQARAAAFKALVGGGATVESAAAVSGLLVDADTTPVMPSGVPTEPPPGR